MDTEVETLPSKSTRQEGYVEAKHCLCIELLPDVNERATRIFARRFVFQTTCLILFFASTL